MAGRRDSVLDKAESFAKRVLERLGSKVDSKLATADKQTLTPREAGELTSRLERAIESNLREDKDGVKRVAPNRFKVLFTYEESSRLNTAYIEALAVELKATAFEYINNRRYETRGPISVETGQDLFAKATVVKASFEGGESARQAGGVASAESSPRTTHSADQSSQTRTIDLESAGGIHYRLALKHDGAPAYIGRASGIGARIDDPSISRLHCSLALRSNSDIVISDLGSSNGTSVNGQPLGSNEAHQLKAGDIIIVGDVRLTVSEIA